MRIRTVGGALAVVVACGLVGVGCGGGSDSSSSSDDTEDTRDTRDSDDSSGDSTGPDASGFFANADCRQLSRALDSSSLGTSLSNGKDPTADLRATAEFLEEASDEAPEEVADDVQVLADAYAELADRSEDVDWDGIRNGNPAAAVGAAQLGQAFADRKFADVARNLSEFAAENCTG